ncbi:N-acetylmuramoyl-L-alanine amidase [Aquibacillus halophilus]|uniref:N-acetylmuramoyl-L-alanine amidase n=1 Tax=Aquibacillus halophilus TaxID=930132 RepID=A0A6A8DRM2_9BACI|nr:N-acetylmuramoyl-L-alanine amidase [Aquibacillus halophilus]
MPYEIKRDYINFGNSRSGQDLADVQFIVSHDTGNPGSSAYANRNYFENVDPVASAHTFIDDNNILEIIPLDEKAWHVRYNVGTDNRIYGEDANDAAIGVELAYGGSINFDEAYKRYVWYHAYLVDKYDLDPSEDIIAHSTLDPSRRTDPQNALNRHGISWSDFINDVERAYDQLQGNEEGSESVVRGSSVNLPLDIGDGGSLVREVQQDLIKAGFSLPIYGVDGQYGPETQRAVLKFQREYGLLVDGLVGPQTLNKLKEVVSSSKRIDDFPLPDVTLRRGDNGSEVKQLQRALKEINFDPKLIDGIYGPLTEDAVRRFQSMYAALANDGIYGPNTRRYIQMELDD